MTTSASAASPFGIRIWDVVVVGSGLAGLSAAVSARENGAENVLVIEKLPILGGHSRVASGSFCAVSEKRLKPYGIKTTVEDAVKESVAIGGPEANAKLLKILWKKANLLWIGLKAWVSAGTLCPTFPSVPKCLQLYLTQRRQRTQLHHASESARSRTRSAVYLLAPRE